MMADWCAVDILSADGKALERAAVAHVDPEKVKWAYELQKRYPVDLNAETGIADVIRTGKTEFTPEITEEMIEGAATDADMYQILVDIGFTSVITAPLVARGSNDWRTDIRQRRIKTTLYRSRCQDSGTACGAHGTGGG